MNGKPIYEGKLPPPVGNSDWEDIVESCYCVDKTLLIKELVDSKAKVALFTRPRRFGKTTAMQMLLNFFEKSEKSKAHLFADKKIWAAGEEYRALQGRFPVIYLTFKDHKALTWESAQRMLRDDIGSEVVRHKEAIEALKGDDKKYATLRRIIEEEASPLEDYARALGYLAEAIHLHEGEKPVVLIDEYDTPVSTASTYGYYDEMVAFLRVFLPGALKDCKDVRLGVMTGVLRVAKEGILSGLNNLGVYTVFDEEFSEHFGFTEAEVEEMAEYYGVPEKMAEIRDWYDGYLFGGTEIYNPWSVANYFQRSCKADTYWLDTSSNDIITELLANPPDGFEENVAMLLEGGRASVEMAKELGPYAHVLENNDTLYALLASAGYLKPVSPIKDGGCEVMIPNLEVRQVFVSDIRSKLTRSHGSRAARDLAKAIRTRNPEAFRDALERFMRESTSYFDGAAEGFYNGLLLGLLGLMGERYKVESNRESGDGRPDIALYPLLPGFPGAIIEVKAAKTARESLPKLAAAARAQIDEKDYASEMRARNVADVMKLGLAFRGKRVALAK